MGRGAESAREQAPPVSQRVPSAAERVRERITGAAEWVSLRFPGAASNQDQYQSSTMPVVHGIPVPTQNVTHANPLDASVVTVFPRVSIRATCRHCFTTADTRLKYVVGWKAHALTLFMLWFVGFFAFFVYCFPEARIVYHYCRCCNSLLGHKA